MSGTLVLKGSHGSGLGDLIRCLLVAIAYARLSDRRLFVDWRGGLYGHPPERNLCTDLFAFEAIALLPSLPEEGTVHPPRWRGVLQQSFADVYRADGELPWDRNAAMQTYSFDLGKLDYSEDILVMWDFDQFGKLRPALERQLGIAAGLPELQAMGLLFERHIRLRPPLQAQLDAAWQALARDRPLLGVHVRLTAESVRSRGAERIGDYHRAIARLQADPRERLFLATDNALVLERFTRRYGDRVVTHPKWFDQPGEPLHLGNARCPDPWQNTVSALLDMLLLARCRALIHPGGSSFSTVSRLIGQQPAERVIALFPRPSPRQRLVGALRRALRRLLRPLRRSASGPPSAAP